MNLLSRLFTRSSPKRKAIRLLEQAAREGDLQAKHLLSIYAALETESCSPIKNSIDVIHNTKKMDAMIRCVRNSPKDIKKAKRKRNRNPKKSKNDI